MVRTLLAINLIFWVSCVSTGVSQVLLEDPIGDDHGPGNYRYPLDRIHAPGAYDLRRVRFSTDKDEIILQIEIRGSFEVAEGNDAARQNTIQGLPPSLRSIEEINSGLFLQNIEIYLDQDSTPSTGEHRSLPGRGVTIASGWEKAIWVSPRPLRARTELARRAPEMARRVIIPTTISVRGRFVEARFSQSLLGKIPSKNWGYTIFVTGAISQDIFGEKQKSLFVRPVLKAPDAESFGGGDIDKPPILDLWVPKGVLPSQEELLSTVHPRIPGRKADGTLVTESSPKQKILIPDTAPTEVVTKKPESNPVVSKENNTELPESQPNSIPSEKKKTIRAEVIEIKKEIITLRIEPGLIAGRIGELETSPDVLIVITEIFGEIGVARLLSNEKKSLIVTGSTFLF